MIAPPLAAPFLKKVAGSLLAISSRSAHISDTIDYMQQHHVRSSTVWLYKLTSFVVGDSATYLYINEVLIRSAKVAVILRGSLSLLVIGLFFVFLVIRVYDLK